MSKGKLRSSLGSGPVLCVGTQKAINRNLELLRVIRSFVYRIRTQYRRVVCPRSRWRANVRRPRFACTCARTAQCRSFSARFTTPLTTRYYILPHFKIDELVNEFRGIIVIIKVNILVCQVIIYYFVLFYDTILYDFIDRYISGSPRVFCDVIFKLMV